jgi:hypothetical protein
MPMSYKNLPNHFKHNQKSIIMKIKPIFTAALLLVASIAWAQNDNCTGTLTGSSDGAPFTEGYTYFFNTSGDQVTATFELLDPVDGLVGFYQTLNPDFMETGPVFPEPGTQVLTETFSGFENGDTFTVMIKFAYAGNFSTGDTLTYTVGDNCGIVIADPVDLPVTFDENVDYDLVDFGGNASSIVADPTDGSNMVAQTIRTAGSEVFAGTTIGGTVGFANPIPFDNANTGMSVRVYSAAAGVPVRLKVENSSNPGVFTEAEVLTTTSGAWETLTYDFIADLVPSSPPLNLGNVYQKASIFFNFGADPGTTPEQTYFWDDVEFAPGVGGINQIDLPITFEDPSADYGLTDFGGNASSIVTDPTNPSNTVVQSIRTAGSEVFAGTTVGQPLGLENPIPFDFDNTGMSVRVWSPNAGTVVKLKVEQVGNPGVFVESDVLTTVAGAFETLEFDFATPAAGALDLNQDYNLVTIFFNFGQDPGTSVEETYFWDDVQFAPGVGGFTPIALPLTFDDPAVTISLGDFGGNASSIVADPQDAGNNVVQSIRTANALSFAGTVAPAQSLTEVIPFEAGSTTLSMRVLAPMSGVPVRMKVENSSGAISAETEVVNSVAGDWETLEFDFSNSLTAPLDFGVDYVKVVVFFNFGLENGPEEIYLWDDVAFEGGPAPCANPYPQVDFSSLSATTLPNGKLRFEWEPIEGQIGCQINIVVGTGPQQASIIRPGPNASFFDAPVNQLVPFTTYNFRVRCGCSQFPLIAGAYTPYAQAFYIPPSITEEQGTGYAETPHSLIDEDAQWSNTNLNNAVIGQLFNMEADQAWVRVAPNPAQDNVNLSYNSKTEGQGLIQVFDAQGKLALERVMTFNEGLNNVNLNLNELQNGIYLVEVIKGESRESVRLLMQ